MAILSGLEKIMMTEADMTDVEVSRKRLAEVEKAEKFLRYLRDCMVSGGYMGNNSYQNIVKRFEESYEQIVLTEKRELLICALSQEYGRGSQEIFEEDAMKILETFNVTFAEEAE